MTKGTRDNLLILGAIALFVVAWLVVGGPHGLYRLITGKSPVRLITANATNIAVARNNGEVLVKVIELYKLDKKEYPRSLQDLVDSKFIESYPESGVGDNEFKYRLDPQKGFVLEYFVGPNYEKDWYEGATAKWYIDR